MSGSAGGRRRVVLVVLDGLPPEAATPAVTPTLWSLAAQHRSTPTTGCGVLCAATYPNHASLITGAGPARHGLAANRVWRDGRFVAGAEVGPGVPTLFDAVGHGGLDSVAVLGDHHLVGVMGAAAATSCWPPPGGRPAPGVALDVFGYAIDEPVADRARRALVDPAALTVVHLNGPDTAGHHFGPRSAEARAAYRRTDAALAGILDDLQPFWESTVVIVLSDHGMEPVDPRGRIDVCALSDELGPGWQLHPEGSSALAVRSGGTVAGPPAWRDVRIEGRIAVGPDAWVLWSRPGAFFAGTPRPAREPGAVPLAGVHGSPRTRAQLVAVGGGDPVVARLAGRLRSRVVPITWWAPTIAALLDVPWPPPAGCTAVPSD